MSSGQKTVTAFLTVIATLVAAIAGTFSGWPYWAWGCAAAVVIALPVLASLTRRRRSDPFPRPSLLEPDVQQPPVERREVQLRKVRIPTGVPDYDFLLTALVRWCPVATADHAPVVNAGGLAVDAVLDRARLVTERREPWRCSLVQHELSGRLAVMEPDRTGRVQAMAVEVALSLPDADQERLDRLAAVRKDEQLWEHERKYEQNRRAYLGKDVLRDTGSAVVWWLNRNDDKVDKTVEDIGLLAQLASAANNSFVAEPFQHLVPQPPEDPEAGVGAPLPDGPPAGPDAAAASAALGADDPVASFADLLRHCGSAEGDPDYVLFADHVAEKLEQRGDAQSAAHIRLRYGSLSQRRAEAQDGYEGGQDAHAAASPNGSAPAGGPTLS
ncbi:hypothetical protein [Streptomyces boninensis]|uniref:hypothetical protein n=1 Tax=Streptomyces boninensis TaxID=2039455 RepID=UPI003B20B7AB